MSLTTQLIEITVILLSTGLIGIWAGNEICTRWVAPFMDWLTSKE